MIVFKSFGVSFNILKTGLPSTVLTVSAGSEVARPEVLMDHQLIAIRKEAP